MESSAISAQMVPLSPCFLIQEKPLALYASTRSQLPTEVASLPMADSATIRREFSVDLFLWSAPLMPTDAESVMLRSAYRAMNEKFGGATVENKEVLELGEIYGEPCRRFHTETSKGDFVAVVNESGEVLSTWSEVEKKSTEFWFPQLCDINVASDEKLMVAYYSFYEGGYHDEDIIYDFEEEIVKDENGKPLWKVVLYTTHCTSTFWIDEFGRVIDRTK